MEAGCVPTHSARSSTYAASSFAHTGEVEGVVWWEMEVEVELEVEGGSMGGRA